jgi:hypothetical protein
MTRITRAMLLSFWALLWISAPMFAADVVIKGTVTDSAGKPVRGAMVSAFAGIKTISRFSQKDGRYEITVAGGTYQVSAEAYGYGIKQATVNTRKPGPTNFKLTAESMDLRRFTGAEEEKRSAR